MSYNKLFIQRKIEIYAFYSNNLFLFSPKDRLNYIILSSSNSVKVYQGLLGYNRTRNMSLEFRAVFN